MMIVIEGTEAMEGDELSVMDRCDRIHALDLCCIFFFFWVCDNLELGD